MNDELRELGDVAYLLVASWLLGAGDKRIPTSSGVLDRALFQERGRLPTWAGKQLHFSDLRAGLRCPELPQILDYAQDALLTSVPNPTYHFTDIRVSEWNALDLLRELDMAPETARELGKALKQRVTAILAGSAESDSAS